jgi:hypothetical protein
LCRQGGSTVLDGAADAVISVMKNDTTGISTAKNPSDLSDEVFQRPTNGDDDQNFKVTCPVR